MKTSESVTEITKALIISRKQFKPFKKDVEGYGYMYTDLSTILEHIEPILLENGILLLQPLAQNTELDHISITTRLQHISGEFIEDTFNISISEIKGANKTQASGAAITYGRRYAISSMLGITSESDIDGKSGNYNNKPQCKQTNQIKHDIVGKRKEIREMLLNACSGDVEKAGSLLEVYTTFENSKGETVKGKRRVEFISDGQVNVVYTKLKERGK